MYKEPTFPGNQSEYDKESNCSWYRVKSDGHHPAPGFIVCRGQRRRRNKPGSSYFGRHTPFEDDKSLYEIFTLEFLVTISWRAGITLPSLPGTLRRQTPETCSLRNSPRLGQNRSLQQHLLKASGRASAKKLNWWDGVSELPVTPISSSTQTNMENNWEEPYWSLSWVKRLL